MAILPNYIESLTHHDRVRYECKVEECGLDPYGLRLEDLSEDKMDWPLVTDVDRMEYLVFRTNFTTKDSMKNYKSLEAHNFLTSGLMFPSRAKKLPGERVLLLGKVRHSQRHSMEPLKIWLLAENNGNIRTGHCNCMAGRSETCSHGAAVIYLLEYTTKAKDSETCTDRQCGWLPPTMNSVPHRTVKDINFRSALARLKHLQALVEGDQPILKSHSHNSLPAMASEDWNAAFLGKVVHANPIAVGLSVHREHSTPFKNPHTSPLDFTKLYDHNTQNLTYSALIEECKTVLSKMKITSEEIKSVEEKTRNQAHSVSWHLYRLGRITGSMVFKVWQGNVNNPARSTWEIICKGKGSDESHRRKSLNKKICWGVENEGSAREEYLAAQRQKHTNFSLSLSGLLLHTAHYFIGSSPDGRVKCDCCRGFGCLEVKCPKEENLNGCLDDEGKLKEDYPYFYQVQTHMLVTGGSYCDLYLYLNRKDPKNPLKNPQEWFQLVRVHSHQEKQSNIVEKCKDYFLYVVRLRWLATGFQEPQLQVSHYSQEQVILFYPIHVTASSHVEIP